MSNRRGGFRGNRNRSHSHKKNLDNVDDNNPIINAFKVFAKELDDKHERYERIVKHSRDITIESKRIIFLLHSIDPKKNNMDRVLVEAHKRLLVLCETHFLSIAKELKDLDPYQYARAYSSGLQEFTEAYTFYEYLSQKKLSSWEDLQTILDYNVDKIKPSEEATESKENNKPCPVENKPKEEATQKNSEKISCLIQPVEFILGLADLTGEVMRRCINSLGSADINACFDSCRMLQSLYTGYLSLNFRHRDLHHKVITMEQSVLKAEDVCYNVKIRGGEAAKWGACESLGKLNDDEDEGFQ